MSTSCGAKQLLANTLKKTAQLTGRSEWACKGDHLIIREAIAIRYRALLAKHFKIIRCNGTAACNGIAARNRPARRTSTPTSSQEFGRTAETCPAKNILGRIALKFQNVAVILWLGRVRSTSHEFYLVLSGNSIKDF